MDLVVKGIVGGLMTAIIAYFAKRNADISGVLIFFPTFSILAIWFIGMTGDTEGIQKCALSAIKTVPSVIGFMATSYLLANRFDFRIVILASFFVWLCIGLIIYKYLP